MIKRKEILNDILQDLRRVAPYVVSFYLLILAISFLLPSFRNEINWTVFNIAALAFFLLAGFERIKEFVAFGHKKFVEGWNSMGCVDRFKLLVSLLLAGFKKLKEFTALLFGKFIKKWKSISWFDRVALLISLLLLGYSIYSKIEILNFIVLTYGLLSFCLVWDSRIPAGFAIALLVVCMFLLIFKQADLAEKSAIFVYYFLIISVATGMRECRREETSEEECG
ncbi:hypothetical protein HZA42_00520 [Candidatus Peregrinibacteria bacterium]|nr:hypothetical protein [Candidatus Peregrinibacteria bacterium]